MAKRILLVDDEPGILTVTVMRLKMSGYEVMQAVSSEDALKLLENIRPDLILLDLLLPGMQGEELCKMLRSDERFKGVPIILFTANIITHQMTRDIGADDYIMKPFESGDLIFKIKKLIG